MKKVVIITLMVALALAVAIPAYAAPAEPPAKGGRAGTLGVVYVTGQGLYYDTFVSAEALPWNPNITDSFQLIAGGQTEFGPGDTGYRGGRWWIDSNPNGYQDANDTFLLCPLLGPGRTSP